MIAHIDMDAFFAKCEELRNPELEGKPVVICVYTRGQTSGAVSTSNYEARKLGIGSGMPLSVAREKANDQTVFLPVDHEYYREKSEEVMSSVKSFSKNVQKTSVDEAYFRLEGDVEEKAKKIRAKIETLGLTASIGVAENKFLAKLASEEDKPDGLKMVEGEKVEEFLSGREVSELHGVGNTTARKLEEQGIRKVEDLRSANSAMLVDLFGKSKAASLKAKAQGKGSKNLESDDQKQISRIKTMARNSSDPDYIMRELEIVAESLDERIKRKDRAFKNVSIIVIDSDLRSYTRSSQIKTSETGEAMLEEAEKLLRELLSRKELEARRVGIRVSDLVDTAKQEKLTGF